MSAGLDFISKRRLHARPEHEADISRICSVPIQYPISDDEFEAVNLMEIKPEAYEHGFRLLRGQAEALLSFRERNGIFAPLKVGAGKCVCGDVEVFDRASGRRRQMREVADSLVLDSLDDELRFQPRLSRSFASGIKPCVRVELASGASIGLSTDHPVRTHLGWVRAEDLTREHLIATPRKLEPGPGVQASDAEIKLIAYLLADGCLRNASVSFCDEPGETVDDVLRCCKELGFSTTVVPERSKAVSVNIRGALEWTRKWGLQEVLSRNKRVPATLYSMGAYQTRLFLGCFWACDGHSNTRSLECTLASEGLLRDLKHLMLYLGICCSIHYKKATIGRKVYDAWRMSISGQDAITFLQEVDVVGQIDKNAKILSAMRCKKRNPNTDVVPIGYEHAGELSTQSGLTPTTIKRKLGLTIGQRISRQAYSHFCHEHLIDDPLATSDLRWVKLKRVVPIGNREVFDASVDEDHNFVANGVVVHNTLVSLRCIAIAMEQGLERCALFVPPQVHEQLVDRDIAWVRRRVELGLTFYPMGGKSPQQRMALAGGRRGCWIFPYSLLSTRDASELLEKIRPQLMVFDEAHMLKHRNSARTKRVWSYWKKHRPQVVALSGTMTSKSLREFAHLMTMALRDYAPVPFDGAVVTEWASVIDSDQVTESYRGERSTSSGPLRPLINWSREFFPQIKVGFDTQGFRQAFQNRMVTTPGVVSSPVDELGVSLGFANNKHDPMTRDGGAQMQKLLHDLDTLWVSPDGDEIEHAMIVWKWKNELTAGIYNSLVWPSDEDCERRGISQQQLHGSIEYHKSRQLYHKVLRSWFSSRPHKIGMDTPFLVASEMKRNGHTNVGKELYASWQDMHSSDFAGRIERDSIPVRVCDYKIAAAVEWMEKHPQGKGIVWYFHQEVGRWLFEAAQAAGLPVLFCPAGKASNVLLADPARCDNHFLICSVSAHGTGKNLQFLTDQLFVQLAPSEQRMEQAVGRTHRQGQEEDLVTIYTMISNEIDEMALAAHLNDATYVFETTGESRKLLIAAWNPVPTIYASEVLVRAGAQAKRLNARQQLLLQERFGE